MISSCLVLLSRSCDRVDWNVHFHFWNGKSLRLGLATEWIEIFVKPPCKHGDIRLGLATEWIEIFATATTFVTTLSRSCDRVDWNQERMQGLEIDNLSRSCDRVDWNGLCIKFRNVAPRLGLATEWIEMWFPFTLGPGPKSRSCDRVDWNSIFKCTPVPPFVSVLRPSGLKYFSSSGFNIRRKSLGLATEWIEIK